MASERRRSPRWLCASIVHIQLIAGADKATYVGIVEDVSTSGLGLGMDGSIAVGCHVLVSDPGREIQGVVRHCSIRGDGEYQVGIEFTGDCVWSVEDEWPAHRVDIPADSGPRDWANRLEPG